MSAATRKQCLAVLFLFLLHFDAGAQYVRFPADSARFAPAGADSVFIFSRDLAVAARGTALDRLGYADGAIRGDGLPGTLKLKDPSGAIIYRDRASAAEIPCIRSRRDGSGLFVSLLRSSVLRSARYRGSSSKNGVEIDAWQRRSADRPDLYFFRDGVVLNSKDFTGQEDAPAIGDLAGLWIDPPEYGVDDIPGMIIRMLSRDALLVVYLDGLGWSAFEASLLQNQNTMPVDTVRMAWAVYPPVTRRNYRAMIRLPGKRNLFQALTALGVSCSVQEGETMIYPVPGRLTLHTDSDPVRKDAHVFSDALADAGDPGLSLLWVHFHGLDDLNHRLGPGDGKTKDHLLTLGDYCRRLRQAWPGAMLIISDHGAHTISPIREGSRGGHGDFIFADMAVPLISLPAETGHAGTAAISAEQAAALLSEASPSLQAEKNRPAEAPGKAALTVIIGADSLTFTAADSARFGETFTLPYERKGKKILYHFKGRRLGELIPGLTAMGVTRITARSADGHTAVFSAADPGCSSLVIRCSPETPVNAGLFALYPPGDRFPNRIVKYLTTIICE